MLKDKKVLLLVTGGIAAYKAIDLVSKLKKEGAIVRTIMTKSALKFVGEINFSALSGERVYTDQFDLNEPIAHISLAKWADVVVVAPCTANFIGKMANGIADDLASSTIIASYKPILVVPAMNVNMYENPITQRNVRELQRVGINILEPEAGMLACGDIGKGKYPDNKEIIFAIKTYLNFNKIKKPIKIMISLGASQENIDPMRFITNHSSGKMGINIARAAYLRGFEVTIVYSKISENIPYYIKNKYQTLSAQSMFDQINKLKDKQDVIVMTAAVADYTPQYKAEQKIKKSGDMDLHLARTKDILGYLGTNKLEGQMLVGFAAESEDIVENCRGKLKRKKLDFIVGNNIAVSGQDTTKAFIVSENCINDFNGSKFALANKIVSKIIELKNER